MIDLKKLLDAGFKKARMVHLHATGVLVADPRLAADHPGWPVDKARLGATYEHAPADFSELLCLDMPGERVEIALLTGKGDAALVQRLSHLGGYTVWWAKA